MTNKKQADFLWKIVLTGDSFVGKTTIRKRAMGEHFAEEYISTVGADFSSYKARIGNLMTSFQIWDLAGQDKYKYIRSSFYGGATACFLVFDVTNPKSLNSVSNWVDEAIRYSNGTIEIFIVCANKMDLKDKRVVSRETGEQLAKALKESSGLQCEYIETSALTGENIDIAFDLMAKCLLAREGITPVKTIEDDIVIPVKVETQEEESEPITPVEETTSLEETIVKSLPIEQIPKEITEKPIKKSVMIGDDDEEETEKLIEEVMSVLDETNEVIIGREKTDQGERVITVPKNSIKSAPVEEKEEEPLITPELERVLSSINFKLDSLTSRLRDLEEEITSVKVNGVPIEQEEKEVDEIEETIEDLRQDLDVLATLEEEEDEQEASGGVIDQVEYPDPQEATFEEPEESISEATLDVNVDESHLDEDQKVLESLLDLEDSLNVDADEEEQEIEIADSEELVDIATNESGTNSSSIDELEELVDLPNDDLVDIVEEEPLEPIEEEHVPKDDSVIGTELSSAMISELKDMSHEASKAMEQPVGQHLSKEKPENKNKCPICGEDAKFIRQYNKYYCTKCGRYLI